MKILICDDEKIFREGIHRILSEVEGIDRIEEAGNADGVINILRKEHFDILLLDIKMPGIGGMELLDIVHNKYPNIRVIMLSVINCEHIAVKAILGGARAYINKDVGAEELKNAVNKVRTEGKYISMELEDKVREHLTKETPQPLHSDFTGRESDIMIKLALGKTSAQIAREMHLSRSVVSQTKNEILRKLKLESVSQLTIYCNKQNLI